MRVGNDDPASVTVSLTMTPEQAERLVEVLYGESWGKGNGWLADLGAQAKAQLAGSEQPVRN